MPSVTRRRSPGPQSRAQIEAQLLAATERLLDQGENFTDLGVQRIAAEAGVPRSSFYTHFRDKTDLLQRLATGMKDTSFSVGAVWEPESPEGGPDGLERIFTETFRIYRRHTALLGAINEVAAYDRAVREMWAEQLLPFTQNVITWLRVEQEAGRTRADIDVDAAGRLIVIGGDRFISSQIAETDADADPAAARELALTWWYGIYRRPEPA
jgi:AcrR family transcriptional regulator